MRGFEKAAVSVILIRQLSGQNLLTRLKIINVDSETSFRLTFLVFQSVPISLF